MNQRQPEWSTRPTSSQRPYIRRHALSTKPVMLIWAFLIPATRSSCSQQSLILAWVRLQLHLVAGIRGAQISITEAKHRSALSPNLRSLLFHAKRSEGLRCCRLVDKVDTDITHNWMRNSVVCYRFEPYLWLNKASSVLIVCCLIANIHITHITYIFHAFFFKNTEDCTLV